MTLFFWLQFLAVCIIGAMSPGPSLALIIRNSLKFNRLSGILSAIGHGLGIGIYASLAIVGLHLILSSNIFLFNFIQVIGAVFLLLLGIIFLLDKENEINLKENQNNLNSFLQGFFIAILNPKILIWFAAIYSQFIIEGSGFIANAILVITASLIDGIWYTIVAIIVTGYGLKEFFQRKKLIIQKISGFALICIAIYLIIKVFNN